MAEEVQYVSGGDSATNKRKYADQSDTPALPYSGDRRATGFSSAPISSRSPDPAPSYNSVAPPVGDFQIAKQKAQEIAARLFNTVEAKRPRVGNGEYDYNVAKGFNSGPTDFVQKPIMSAVASIPASYGYPGPSKKIEIPNGRVGVIIGKSGDTIRYLQLQSGAKIQVTRDLDADLNAPTRVIELKGTPDQIAKAEQLISDVLSEAESGGSGIDSRRKTGQQGGAELFVMKVPNNKVGLIIGKGGDTIKNMQNRTGARIQVIPLHLPPGDTSMERTVQIDGSSKQIEAAKLLVNEVISENHLRNQAMSGYSQQGYQARPPTSWAPPGQQMQPGYGYIQPGAYTGGPGQTPQYNMTQPHYAGYPPQTTSGEYATGWDQTTATTNQQSAQGGGYDYYSQQSAPQKQQAPGGASGPADNAGYGYQQPASGYTLQGQGYTQDSYGGYHASAPQPGYGQPQPGYDQQQGYNSTPGYGNVANQTADGKSPSDGAQGDGNQAPQSTTTIRQQGYNASQQPSPNHSYPPQGPTLPGYHVLSTSQTGYRTQPPSGYAPSYGAPQTQKPAAGQPQQSPTAQGGYVQAAPVQPGYPQSQPPPAQAGFGQLDSGAQRAPPSGYGAGQAAGYAPPPYNSVYGSGYSQPAVYSADGIAAPASQAVPPSAVATQELM